MKFTEEQLDSFIALYWQEFGRELSRQEALEQATDLVELVRQVYRPMGKEDLEEYLGL